CDGVFTHFNLLDLSPGQQLLFIDQAVQIQAKLAVLKSRSCLQLVQGRWQKIRKGMFLEDLPQFLKFWQRIIKSNLPAIVPFQGKDLGALPNPGPVSLHFFPFDLDNLIPEKGLALGALELNQSFRIDQHAQATTSINADGDHDAANRQKKPDDQ